MTLLHAAGHALALAGGMTWQILWALLSGFLLSAVVQAVVPKARISRLLPDRSVRSMLTATALGAASSSCSYAAVALARGLVRKGADFTAAIAFQVAATNLVAELGLVLAVLVGWQFTAAEFSGGLLMVLLVAAGARLLLPPAAVATARRQAARGLAGSMEGHAAMDMSVSLGGPQRRRATISAGFTAIADCFVMDWAAVYRDVAAGLLLAGALAAWVPGSFWRHLFFVGQPLLAGAWGPLIGPLVAVLSFVCSVGNVPLAAVLWNGGISFGGVVSFVFADLLIVPILLIQRKYYGTAMAVRLLVLGYATAAVAGYVVQLVFEPAGLVPTARHAKVVSPTVGWDYTTALNALFLLLAGVLVYRFGRTGGLPMLRMMGGGPDDSPDDPSHRPGDGSATDRPAGWP